MSYTLSSKSYGFEKLSVYCCNCSFASTPTCQQCTFLSRNIVVCGVCVRVWCVCVYVCGVYVCVVCVCAFVYMYVCMCVVCVYVCGMCVWCVYVFVCVVVWCVCVCVCVCVRDVFKKD